MHAGHIPKIFILCRAPSLSQSLNQEILVTRYSNVEVKKEGKEEMTAERSHQLFVTHVLVHPRPFASEFWPLTASGDYVVNSQDHIRSFRRRFDRI